MPTREYTSSTRSASSISASEEMREFPPKSSHSSFSSPVHQLNFSDFVLKKSCCCCCCEERRVSPPHTELGEHTTTMKSMQEKRERFFFSPPIATSCDCADAECERGKKISANEKKIPEFFFFSPLFLNALSLSAVLLLYFSSFSAAELFFALLRSTSHDEDV